MQKSNPNSFTIDDVRREIRTTLDPLKSDLRIVLSDVESLQNAAKTANQSASFGEIVNLLDNSHPEWSKAAYLATGVLPTDATDANHEAHNWFRVLSSTTGLAQSAANAVKDSAHSLFAAVEGANDDVPRWDRENGQIEIGGVAENWDLIYKLPTNLVFPGMTFYVQFEAGQTGDALPADLQIFAEFFDNSAGQQKVIEGGNFTITGEIFGSPGASAVEYLVVAETDSGEEAVSNVLHFADAPAVFDRFNHPRISFRGAPGFIKFSVYRYKDGVYSLQEVIKNAIESTFFDINDQPKNNLAAFPSVTATPPRAFAKTRNFAPGSSGVFVRHSLTILVPTTYNRTNTAPDSQWLRIGLTGLTPAARQIVLRRFGLSSGYGQWARSAGDARDGAHSSPSSSPVSSSSGGSGGGVSSDPPDYGSGGDSCVLLNETNINIIDLLGKVAIIPVSTLAKTLFVDSCGAVGGRVLRLKTGHASRIYRLKTANNLTLACTFSHPLITSYTDFGGTPAARLKADFDARRRPMVLTKLHDKVAASEIVEMTEEYGAFEVGIPELEGSHICVLNGILSHNLIGKYYNTY